jgi:hypothetical protein
MPWIHARHPRLHNVNFAELHETFLVTGVATILVIRTQLWLTNYPQLGGAGLHIAHLLWGGALMVVAIGLLLTFVGPGIRHTAAIVGGIGFGFFIDELGKFITADNDYFFRPAAALIYVIFVALFMLARSLERRTQFGAREYLGNAIDLLAAAARRPLEPSERLLALEMLDRADPTDRLVVDLRAVVSRLEPGPEVPPGPVAQAVARVRAAGADVVAQPWWPQAVTLAFAAWAVLSTWQVWELVLSVGMHLGHARAAFASDSIGDLQLINAITLGSSLVSVAFVVVGILRLRHGDRLGAYRCFERALLVAILVTRVFCFVESQFHAVFGLAVDLLLLVALRSATARERLDAL